MAAISSAPRRHAESAEPRRSDWMTRLLLTLALVGCDVLAVNAALLGVYHWRMPIDLQGQALPADAGMTVPLFLVLVNLAFMVTFSSSGLYMIKRGGSRIDEAFKVLVAVSLGVFGALIINYILPQFGRDTLPTSGMILILGWLGAVAAVVALRLIYRAVLSALRARGFDNRRVLIVGAREPGRVVNSAISRSPGLGYRVQGFLSSHVPAGTLLDGVPVLGRPASLGRVIRLTRADEVIIALSGRSSSEVLDIVTLADDEAVEIKLYPDAFQLITNNGVSIGDVNDLPLIKIKSIALDSPVNQALKRALDIAVSIAVMTLTAPLMLLIALLIKLDSPGPVFFVQERVGLDGVPFPVLKFRGMRQDAPALAAWTVKDDPRVTPIGSLLRRYSLDELPQFMNVLRGEMSVVGHRPEQPVWVEKFSQSIPRYVRRHKQKVGITGWAQINGLRGDTSIEERTRYDLYYVENWSLLFDLKIIIKTALGIASGNNSGY